MRQVRTIVAGCAALSLLTAPAATTAADRVDEVAQAQLFAADECPLVTKQLTDSEWRPTTKEIAPFIGRTTTWPFSTTAWRWQASPAA